MVRYTFKKEERLCNKRLLTSLFQSGSSFVLYPYRISFLKAQHLAFPAQVVISVPKRRFKRAVDRNLLKRRIREAYRMQKEGLLYAFLQTMQTEVLLSIHYIGTDIPAYKVLYKQLTKALEKLQHEYRKQYMETVD